MSIITAPELCFVRPGEPAKKKRRSADAVALGSTQRQAKHEHASVGYGSGSSRLLTGSKARVDPQQAYQLAKTSAPGGVAAPKILPRDFLYCSRSVGIKEVCFV